MIRQAIPFLTCVLALALNVAAHGAETDERQSTKELPAQVVLELLQSSCLDCHNDSEAKAGLNLESVAAVAIARNSEVWEKVVRKLCTRQMPPGDMPRPEESTYVSVLNSLERTLDEIAADHPRPSRTDTFRRLTRTEYQNAIRDLLSLDVDVTTLLPADEASHGLTTSRSGNSRRRC